MKVMSIVGTRPELIKMSEIIKKLDKFTDHVFVHTGQNHDKQLNDVFYKDLGLRKPDHQLEWHGNDLGAQLASNFFDMSKVLMEESPDAVVILGDTNSALAGILVKRMKIPLFHLEAGNRCFDDNVPEEINRRILDHIADVNMVYTQNQRLYLRDEGIAKDRLFIMGSPMKEIILSHLNEIKQSKILDTLRLKPKQYFVVSIHRDENTEDEKNLSELLDALAAIHKKYKLPLIVSTHPRLKKKLEGQEVKGVLFHKPFGFLDYIFLQANSKCVISDSGTISEESAILAFPAITVRNAIERPEAVDVGSILMTSVDKVRIMDCLEAVDKGYLPGALPPDYDISNCSERVLRVILGYTPYINKKVWSK